MGTTEIIIYCVYFELKGIPMESPYVSFCIIIWLRIVNMRKTSLGDSGGIPHKIFLPEQQPSNTFKPYFI